jgi:hypothetical protein
LLREIKQKKKAKSQQNTAGKNSKKLAFARFELARISAEHLKCHTLTTASGDWNSPPPHASTCLGQKAVTEPRNPQRSSTRSPSGLSPMVDGYGKGNFCAQSFVPAHARERDKTCPLTRPCQTLMKLVTGDTRFTHCKLFGIET